jgi:hypothetical protein
VCCMRVKSALDDVAGDICQDLPRGSERARLLSPRPTAPAPRRRDTCPPFAASRLGWRCRQEGTGWHKSGARLYTGKSLSPSPLSIFLSTLWSVHLTQGPGRKPGACLFTWKQLSLSSMVLRPLAEGREERLVNAHTPRPCLVEVVVGGVGPGQPQGAYTRPLLSST